MASVDPYESYDCRNFLFRRIFFMEEVHRGNAIITTLWIRIIFLKVRLNASAIGQLNVVGQPVDVQWVARACVTLIYENWNVKGNCKY